MSNELVRKGYENAAERYLAQRDQFASTPYLDMLAERLKPGATVLDAGCGAGIPIDRYLVQHGYCVIGLDIAKKQIALARTLVPQATYQVRDMSTLKRGEFQVDAVVSFLCDLPHPASNASRNDSHLPPASYRPADSSS